MSEEPGSRWHAPTLASSGPVAAPEPGVLGRALAEAAVALGFARIGFAPIERFERGALALEQWLESGYAGAMSYLAGAGDRADPRALLSGARTLVSVALPYSAERSDLVPLKGRDGRTLVGSIARYARGDDYHPLLWDRLQSLADHAANLVNRPVLARPCVDTAPLLEREAAARAGIAFLGKNALAIVPGVGSYVLLGELLLDVELAPGEPLEPRCGTCRACLDACPTGAFVDAYVLDARRCISYLTIEYTGVIERELRPLIGTRVFGCDVCQEVCPYNASPSPRPSAPELAPRSARHPVDLVEMLELGSATYRKFVKNSALRRANRATLARNAAIALGNLRDPAGEEPLIKALEQHPAAVVRGHAAWALGELASVATVRARDALERAAERDADDFVRDEAERARQLFDGVGQR